MKKTVAFLLLISLMLTAAPAPAAAHVCGADGAAITRGEAAVMIDSLLRLPNATACGFSDIDAHSPYFGAVARLAAAGLLTGYGDGTVRPLAGLSRQEAVCLAARAFCVSFSGRAVLPFTDGGDIARFAVPAVSGFFEHGWLRGGEGVYFRPREIMTRGEFSALLDSIVCAVLPGSVPVSDSGVTVINRSFSLSGAEADVLLLSPGLLDGTVTLTDVTADEMYILGGGTVTLAGDCSVGTLTVSAPGVRLSIGGQCSIDALTVSACARDCSVVSLTRAGSRTCACPSAEVIFPLGTSGHYFFRYEAHPEVDFDDMRFGSYDGKFFNSVVKECRMLLTGGQISDDDYDLALEDMSLLYDEYVTVETYDMLAYIDMLKNPGDSSARELYAELESACVSMAADYNDLLSLLYLLDGGETAEEAAEKQAEYLASSAELNRLMAEENRLETEYYETAAAGGDCSQIYLDLCRCRYDMAPLLGYDDYVSYAYDAVWARDYLPSDADILNAAVREIFAPDYYRLRLGRYEPVELSDADLLAILKRSALAMGPDAAEAYDYMLSHGLYAFVDDPDSTYNFTVHLRGYNSPFLFISRDGTTHTVLNTLHEFGHYINEYYNPYLSSSMDLCEIHSNGYMILSAAAASPVLGREMLSGLVGYMLEYVVNYIVFSCECDVFEKTVLADPYSIEPDDLDRIYMEVLRSFGAPIRAGSSEGDSGWQRQFALFEQPLYFISYAVSNLPVLELFFMYEDDPAAARDAYMRLASLGAPEYSYFDILSECGFGLFTDVDFLQSLHDRLYG